ncbi:hypothetical protein TNCV_4151 [Trichonephila clavipes]|nr:hypothetical protein TNCV_4151 [Trichonephila clavipes]
MREIILDKTKSPALGFLCEKVPNKNDTHPNLQERADPRAAENPNSEIQNCPGFRISLTSYIEENVRVIEGIAIEGMTSIQGRYCTFCKRRIIALVSSLVQMDNIAPMLNGQLHNNDYEGRKVTLYKSILPAVPQSLLDTSAVAKPEKYKLQSSFTFDFSSYTYN